MKLLIILALSITQSFANETNKDVVYKYKEYEMIDLGSLEIKGQILAPGDITVNERQRQTFKRELLEKSSFDFENIREIENLR